MQALHAQILIKLMQGVREVNRLHGKILMHLRVHEVVGIVVVTNALFLNYILGPRAHFCLVTCCNEIVVYVQQQHNDAVHTTHCY